mgnify:CR=1 FL=1
MDEKFAQFAIAHILFRQATSHLAKLQQTLAAIETDHHCRSLPRDWKLAIKNKVDGAKKELVAAEQSVKESRSRLINYCVRNRQPDEINIVRDICGLRVSVCGIGETTTVIVSSHSCKLV